MQKKIKSATNNIEIFEEQCARAIISSFSNPVEPKSRHFRVRRASITQHLVSFRRVKSCRNERFIKVRVLIEILSDFRNYLPANPKKLLFPSVRNIIYDTTDIISDFKNVRDSEITLRRFGQPRSGVLISYFVGGTSLG